MREGDVPPPTRSAEEILAVALIMSQNFAESQLSLVSFVSKEIYSSIISLYKLSCNAFLERSSSSVLFLVTITSSLKLYSASCLVHTTIHSIQNIGGTRPPLQNDWGGPLASWPPGPPCYSLTMRPYQEIYCNFRDPKGGWAMGRACCSA